MKNRLAKLPVSLFSSVMGMMGVGMLSRLVEKTFALPWKISILWGIVGIVVFTVVAILYILKLALNFKAVKEEFFHPVAMSFFATATISTMLVGYFLQNTWSYIGEWFIIIGAIAHLILTLFIFSQWVRQTHFEIHHMNPSWFIPIVGLVLIVPLGGNLFPQWALWFFLAVGGFSYVTFGAILLYRIIFHHPLPEKLAPTLMILIAPPSALALSFVQLIGAPLGFAWYSIAVSFVLLLLTLVDMFMKVKFDLSWWAYTFPLALFGNGTMAMAMVLPVLRWVGLGMAIVVNLLALGILITSLVKLFKGSLFVPSKE
jgi:tellurite resistance protein